VNRAKRALILVDIQNDFCPGGALAVPDGDAIVPVVNAIMPQYKLVVATQDWHPPGHASFASSHGARPGDTLELDGFHQVLWPDHCVQGTPGAEFVSELNTEPICHVFQKGTDPVIDSYSGFLDMARRHSTGLGDYLRQQGVTQVHVVGLATDYCVRFTAMDARGLGFDVTVLVDATRAVELHSGDKDSALEDMRQAGIRIELASAAAGDA